VSAHYILPREPYEGCDVIKCVDDNDVAYHAGESQWSINGETRTNINNYSIGIELEGDGNIVAYTDYQYENLINLIKDLTSKHSIPEQNIVGHEEVAPGRKVDPGKLFDWKHLRKRLSSDSFPETFCDEPPKTVPDDEFFMGGGDNTEESNNGLFGGFFTMFSPMLLKIFKR